MKRDANGRQVLPDEVKALGYKDVDEKKIPRYGALIAFGILVSTSTLLINMFFALPLLILPQAGYRFGDNNVGYLCLFAAFVLSVIAVAKIRARIHERVIKHSYMYFLALNKKRGVEEGSWLKDEEEPSA